MRGTETKIFDPADGFAPLTDIFILTDASVVKRDNRWWMYLAGRGWNRVSIELFSASLPEGSPLAARGWQLTSQSGDHTKIADLAGALQYPDRRRPHCFGGGAGEARHPILVRRGDRTCRHRRGLRPEIFARSSSRRFR